MLQSRRSVENLQSLLISTTWDEYAKWKKRKWNSLWNVLFQTNSTEHISFSYQNSIPKSSHSLFREPASTSRSSSSLQAKNVVQVLTPEWSQRGLNLKNGWDYRLKLFISTPRIARSDTPPLAPLGTGLSKKGTLIRHQFFQLPHSQMTSTSIQSRWSTFIWCSLHITVRKSIIQRKYFFKVLF